MIAVLLLLAMIIYGVSALVMTMHVHRLTGSKTKGVLVAILFLLFPTWDVLVGYAVYYSASLYWPKEEIFNTVQTDSIYYDFGDFHAYHRIPDKKKSKEDQKIIIFSATDALIKGFRFVETRVTGILNGTKRKNFLGEGKIYRCHLPKGIELKKRKVWSNMICKEVPERNSRYIVSESRIKLGTSILTSKTIYDSSTDKTLAVQRKIILKKYIGYYIPFFNWTNWGKLISSAEPGTLRFRPAQSQYQFEFNVLRPN